MGIENLRLGDQIYGHSCPPEQQTMLYDFRKDVKNVSYEIDFVNWLIKKKVPKDMIWHAPEDEEYKDYDVAIMAEDGNPLHSFEIKRDYWFMQTGNILIEDMYNVEEGKPGWIRYTKAEWIIIFITDNNFYAVRTELLRRYFESFTHMWIKSEIPQNGGKFHTRNYLIRHTYLPELKLLDLFR